MPMTTEDHETLLNLCVKGGITGLLDELAKIHSPRLMMLFYSCQYGRVARDLPLGNETLRRALLKLGDSTAELAQQLPLKDTNVYTKE